MKRKPLLRTLLIATSVFVAGNFMTCMGASGMLQSLTGNYNLMATEVQALSLKHSLVSGTMCRMISEHRKQQ